MSSPRRPTLVPMTARDAPSAAIAGGSGLLGRALGERLTRDGYRVLTLTRKPRPGVATDIAWAPDGSVGPWARALEGARVVVNLAGENLAAGRWTVARKQRLWDSRMLATRSLARAIGSCRTPPPVFISASAVGYYGDRGDESVTEVSTPGSDWLAALCAEWEREAAGARPAAAGDGATRLAIVRTGLVLARDGGALDRLLLPFRLGLGARLGKGRQYMSWIHIRDWVDLVCWIVDTPEAHGAFNLTAPRPVTNAEFTRTLARVLRRPAVVVAPAFALRLLLGEMAGVLLTGQRALPVHAEQLGCRFAYGDLEAALRDLAG